MLNDAISQMDPREAYGPTQHEQNMLHAFSAIAELFVVISQKDEALAALQPTFSTPTRQIEVFI